MWKAFLGWKEIMLLIIVPQVKGQRREEITVNQVLLPQGSITSLNLSPPPKHSPNCNFFSFQHLYEPNTAHMYKTAPLGVLSRIFFRKSPRPLIRYYCRRLVLSWFPSVMGKIWLPSVSALHGAKHTWILHKALGVALARGLWAHSFPSQQALTG